MFWKIDIHSWICLEIKFGYFGSNCSWGWTKGKKLEKCDPLRKILSFLMSMGWVQSGSPHCLETQKWILIAWSLEIGTWRYLDNRGRSRWDGSSHLGPTRIIWAFQYSYQCPLVGTKRPNTGHLAPMERADKEGRSHMGPN